MSTVSLAVAALRQAQVNHSKAQADNVRCKGSCATRGLLRRAEDALAKAEASVAAARTVALTHGWSAR